MGRGRPLKGHEIDWDAEPLGQDDDATIAKRLGCSRAAVGTARRKRRILTARYFEVRTSIGRREAVQQKFKANTVRDPATGCLIWTGRLDSRNQYGVVRFRDDSGKVEWRAHRVAWVLAGKPIDPDKPYICHSCDNTRCVEISHLWAGTAQENNRDRSLKDRSHKSLSGYPRGVYKVRDKWEVRIVLASSAGGVSLGQFDTMEAAAKLSKRAHELRNGGAPASEILKLRFVRARYRCCFYSYSRKPCKCKAQARVWLVMPQQLRCHSGPLCDEHAKQTIDAYREIGIVCGVLSVDGEAINKSTIHANLRRRTYPRGVI